MSATGSTASATVSNRFRANSRAGSPIAWRFAWRAVSLESDSYGCSSRCSSTCAPSGGGIEAPELRQFVPDFAVVHEDLRRRDDATLRDATLHPGVVMML